VSILKASPDIKMPQLNYGYPAMYAYFKMAMKFLVNHQDLCSDVFLRVKTIGNLISLIRLYSNFQSSERIFALTHRDYIQKKNEKTNGSCAYSDFIDEFTHLNALKQSSSDNLNINDFLQLTKEFSEKELSIRSEKCLISKSILASKKFINEKGFLTVWIGDFDISNSLHMLEKKRDVCKFLSLVNFIFSMKTSNDSVGKLTLYGDGVFIASSFLLVISEMKDRYWFYDYSTFLQSLDDPLDIDRISNEYREAPISQESLAELEKLVKKNSNIPKTNSLCKELLMNKELQSQLKDELDSYLKISRHGTDIIRKMISEFKIE